MTFQLSTFLPYKNAVFARAEGDYASARIEFRKCLAAGRAAGGPPMIAGLLFRLGDVEALDGNRDQAIELYEEALLADPGSPLSLVSYAESMFTIFGETTPAKDMLRKAELLISSGAWQPTEDDVSREGYDHLIAKLRAEIESAK